MSAGVDIAGEGIEEVLSDLGSAIGQKMTYMSEKEFSDLFNIESAMDSFIGGSIMAAFGAGGKLVSSEKKGRDYTTGLTASEEAVAQKVYDDLLKEATEGGKKLSAGKKNQIWDQAVEAMDKGYISTDTIGEVLYGDDYKTMSELAKKEKNLRSEYKPLYNTRDIELSQAQRDRRDALKTEIDEIQSKRKTLLEQTKNKVAETAKYTRLAESYREQARSTQAFQADVSKYQGKAREVVQDAIDSGVLNNTNKTHDFVDLIAKIVNDTGLNFKFTNNKKLKGTSFWREGQTVNGFVTKDGVTINVDSKKAFGSVVGHEITHVLEGSDLYKPLTEIAFKLAKEKGEYNARTKALQGLYGTTDVSKELAADLIGDYLFRDEAFVRALSTENQSLFKKVWNEVKHLYKLATAGSKEARELERLKHTFEKVYRETKAQTPDGTKYSLSNGSKKEAQTSITYNFKNTVDSVLNGTYNGSSSVLIGYTPDIMLELGVPSLPVVIGTGHIYSTVKTEAEAKKDGRYNRRNHYHGLDKEVLKNIYEKLCNPEMVIASKDVGYNFPVRSIRSVVSIVDVGTNGNSLLLPVELTVERQVDGMTMDVNVLSSAYHKNVDGLIQEAIAQENAGDIGVFYIKNKTAGAVAFKGLIPKAAYRTSVSGIILHQIPEKVNLKIQDQTQTRQFLEWFGDWQNNPSRASKVVNSDGTPKIMYRGDSDAFAVFDRSKTKYTNLYGRGFYFTDSKSHAEQYGNSRAFYLNVRNPVPTQTTTFTKGQMRRFLEAVKNNDDYSFENYGYGATVESVLRSVYGKSDFSMLYDVSLTAVGDTVEAIELFNKVNGTNYDGFILDTETVVFSPTQIKSATENVGTFDKDNPDIRYSLSNSNTDAKGTAKGILDAPVNVAALPTKRTTRGTKKVTGADVPPPAAGKKRVLAQDVPPPAAQNVPAQEAAANNATAEPVVNNTMTEPGTTHTGGSVSREQCFAICRPLMKFGANTSKVKGGSGVL